MLFCQKRFFGTSFFFDNLVIAHKVRGNLQDFFRHGRAKKQDSAVWICLGKNCLDIIDKAHVEHFISFIQNKIIDFRDIKDFPFHQVLNSPRSTDNYFEAFFQGTNLLSHSLTAVAGNHSREGIGRKAFDFLTNLKAKFPRRRKDECLWCIRLLCNFLNKRKSKSGSFTGSSSSFGNHVRFAVQKPWNCKYLNWRRNLKTF